MVSMKVARAVAGLVAESCTSTVNEKVPVAVGVPEIVALGLPEVKVRPDGSDEPDATLKVYGAVPPVAVMLVLG